MSTCDVPGANPANSDDLHMGCWAEHNDGSLMFVESTEAGRVVYTMFDMSSKDVVEFRDTMSMKGFNKLFTKTEWTWHDKTPFDWDRVIKAGATPGHKYPSADAQISAAEKVAKARKAKGHVVDKERWTHLTERVGRKGMVIIDKLQRAVGQLRT